MLEIDTYISACTNNLLLAGLVLLVVSSIMEYVCMYVCNCGQDYCLPQGMGLWTLKIPRMLRMQWHLYKQMESWLSLQGCLRCLFMIAPLVADCGYSHLIFIQQEQDPTNLYFSGLPKEYDEKVKQLLYIHLLWGRVLGMCWLLTAFPTVSSVVTYSLTDA